jgi:GPH family glycoside/pentoside/hexuronide:cation symporter
VTTTLEPSVRRGYALGSVATGAFGTVPGLLLLPYLTDSLGISAVAAAVIVFLPKAWDAVINPVAGRVSDAHASLAGPRRPFLLRAGVGLAVSFALIFSGPSGPTWLAAGWVVLAYLACATAYGFFQVPYVAMPAEITDDYDERTRLMTWRVAVLALAILVSGASAPAIRDAVGGHAGYRAMGIAVGAMLLVGAVGAYVGTRRAPVGVVHPTAGSLRDQLAVVARLRDFRLLLTTYVVQALAIGCLLAGVDYLARLVLDSTGASTVLFACFVGPALLVTPLWQRVGARWGKRTGYVAASVLLCVGSLGVVGARSVPPALVFATTAVIGIGYAGAQVFPLAMLADTAAVDASSTGENRTGLLTGVWTAAETVGLAIGPGVFALVLAAGGYVSSAGDEVVQPDSALTAITLGMSLLPAALVLLSLLSLTRYSIDAATVTVTAELDRR